MKNQLNTNTQKLSGLRNGFVAPAKYRQESFIGAGGMKTVVRVHDAEAGRSVALAVAKKCSDGSMTQFTREALLTAGLEHPNIVPVHEIGTTADGIPYFTMKLLSGETLQEIVDKLRKGDPETIRQYPLTAMLSIFLKICDGVAFAHSKGVYHLDLKPSNIQVGKFGEVLVLDWGLARTAVPGDEEEGADRDLPFRNHCGTQDGVVRGTPEYMAPEQALGRNRLRGPKWDIYSLGGILHAMLTLHPPVDDTGSRREIFRRVVSGHLYGVRRGNFFKVPASLQFIMYKAMDRRPVMRYDSVLELKQDVERYLSGYPALAEKAGFYTRAILFLKRRRSRIFLGFSLFFFFLMLLALTSARLYYKKLELDIYRHTEWQRRDAERKRQTLEQRMRLESARYWRKIRPFPGKIPFSEFRIEGTLCWTGGSSSFTLGLDASSAKQDRLYFRFSPDKGTVSVIKNTFGTGRRKELILREYAFVFAPGNEYDFLLEGLPAEGGKVSLSLSVNRVIVFSGFIPDFRVPPEKAEIRFLSGSAILSDISASERTVPLKVDLLDLADVFLRKGNFSVASELFRTAAYAATDPGERGKAFFLADEILQLPSFLTRIEEMEQKLRKLFKTESLELKMEGWYPALSVNGGIFPSKRLPENMPIRILRLHGTKMSDPSVLSRLRLHTLEMDRCDLNTIPVLNGTILQDVCLKGNPVRNLDQLRHLSLRHLTVSDGKVQDISPLSEMTSLRELNLSGNQISSAEPLSRLKLIRLVLDRNRIRNLEFLQEMHSLEDFSAEDNRIFSTSPVEGRTFRNLNLQGNPVAVPKH